MYQQAKATLLSLFLLAVPVFCLADIIQVVDEDFNEPLNAFFLSPFASENATAGITLGDVAGSQGVIYTGTWQISPETTEFSSGLVAPLFPPNTDFQFDPREVDGVAAVSYTVDAVLNGFPGDSLNNLFLVLVIYQQNEEGLIDVFSQRGVTTSVENTTLQSVTVDLAINDFEDFNGNPPDVGPDGRPFSFGIQLGAQFDDQTFTGFEQGHLSIDNWEVFVEVPDRIFQDRFEEPPEL